jgi:hypothetical protein
MGRKGFEDRLKEKKIALPLYKKRLAELEQKLGKVA